MPAIAAPLAVRSFAAPLPLLVCVCPHPGMPAIVAPHGRFCTILLSVATLPSEWHAMILPPSLQGYDEDARLNGLEATVEPEQVDLHGLVPVPPCNRDLAAHGICACDARPSLLSPWHPS